MSGKLARVAWRTGQTLLPDHFVALEDSLLEESSERFRLSGLPAAGVGAVAWNESLLTDGVLSVSRLLLVTGAGRLLDVPGNARVKPLNLNVPGTQKVSVFAHLLPAQSGEQAAGSWSGAGGDVPRVVNALALSADQSYPDALETLKLAEFTKDASGAWGLGAEYVPPLLRVGASPFLMERFGELGPALEGFEHKLVMDAASYLSGSGLYMLRQCLRSVYRVRRLLANLSGQVHLHPYFVYEALKDFYVEVCFYHGAVPKEPSAAYEHDKLAECFASILGPLFDQLVVSQEKSPYRTFQLRDGVHKMELDGPMLEAEQLYLLVQKSEVHSEAPLDELKLASPARLPLVHKLSLQGIPLRRADQPMLAHSFGPEVEFLEVVKGDEWTHACREGAVAFYHRRELRGLEFYLYWYG